MVHLDMLVLAWILGLTAGYANLQVSEDYENSTLTLDTPEVDAGSVINVKRTRNRLVVWGCGFCNIYPGFYIGAGNNAARGRKNTMQDCANWCAGSQFSKSCKAWTYNYAYKYCWLKTTDGPMGCPGGDCSTSQWVSGTKYCDIGQNGCPNVLNAQGSLFPNGKYTKMDNYHHNKPVYKHEAGKFCIFFARHWKVDGCDFIRPGGDWSQGLAWSKIDALCPHHIGQGWRYYIWPPATSESGPIAPSIKITC